ncbi:Methyltransferase FkbM domain protein [Candidatus Methanoperedenaceae archaeon GB50]|nr:Methyltransferase FkbM domain protein [Candidatus Methanoperedenaceae archaeon GB50]CAD7778459.1 MAG: Methyltransferase FkbM domain protein [Candidatus Methanoperedenaceae archaeon GB50]
MRYDSWFEGSTETVSVESVSPDSIVEDADVVKIDVEGGELEVLRGMKNLLAKGKVKIICEVHTTLLSSLGYSTQEITKLLNQYGYNIYLINEEGLIPITSLTNEYGHYLFTKERIK